MAVDYHGKARFLKVVAKENESTDHLAKRFKVKTIPSFYVLRNGEVIDQEEGIQAEVHLRSTLNELVR